MPHSYPTPPGIKDGDAVYWSSPLVRQALRKFGISQASVAKEASKNNYGLQVTKSLLTSFFHGALSRNGRPANKSYADTVTDAIQSLAVKKGIVTKFVVSERPEERNAAERDEQQTVFHRSGFFFESAIFAMAQGRGAPIETLIGQAAKAYYIDTARLANKGYVYFWHAERISRALFAELHGAGRTGELNASSHTDLIRSTAEDKRCFQQAYFSVKY